MSGQKILDGLAEAVEHAAASRRRELDDMRPEELVALIERHEDRIAQYASRRGRDTWRAVKQGETLLRAMTWFSDYERSHRAKGDTDKADRNATRADACAEAFNFEPEPVTIEGPSFQSRVLPWLATCFGPMIAGDREERNHRFLEEALELVQACGCTAGEARQLVDYVYGRPVGDPPQEVGGSMVTLAALCLANGIDMHEAGETELARIWTKVDAIRAKQAAKPKYSPLPQHLPQTAPADALSAPVAADVEELVRSARTFSAYPEDMYGRLADALTRQSRQLTAMTEGRAHLKAIVARLEHDGEWALMYDGHAQDLSIAKAWIDQHLPQTAGEKHAHPAGKEVGETDTWFTLEWIGAARPPVHPEPMTGRQSFPTMEKAVGFMRNQAADAKFVSLSEVTKSTIDRSDAARAALDQGGE